MSSPAKRGTRDRQSGSRIDVYLAALLLVSVASCLVFTFSYPLPKVRYDAAEYLALSRSMATGTGFSQDGGVTPAVNRPPFFSLLPGDGFTLPGPRPFRPSRSSSRFSTAWRWWRHFYCSSRSGRRLPGRWGRAFPRRQSAPVTQVVFVYQETTLILFTTLAVLASVRLVRRPSALRARLAGVAWGACTPAKIVCWYAPFLLLAMRFLPSRLRRVWRRKEAVLLLLLFVVVVARGPSGTMSISIVLSP